MASTVFCHGGPWFSRPLSSACGLESELTAGDVYEPGLPQLRGEVVLVVDPGVAPEAHEVVEHLARTLVRLAADRVEERDVLLEAHLRVAVLVEGDDLAQIGGREPHDAAGPQHAVHLRERTPADVLGHVLDDVLAEHVLHAAVGERHPAGHVEVQVAPDEVGVQPARERHGPRADLQSRRGRVGDVAVDDAPPADVAVAEEERQRPRPEPRVRHRRPLGRSSADRGALEA